MCVPCTPAPAGPLLLLLFRLEIRDKALQIALDTPPAQPSRTHPAQRRETEEGGKEERVWDVHFNISPIEKEGHFLLVPDMSLEHNRREQRLTLQDCADMARMAQVSFIVY
jgi:hypothetical protein